MTLAHRGELVDVLVVAVRTCGGCIGVGIVYEEVDDGGLQGSQLMLCWWMRKTLVLLGTLLRVGNAGRGGT
jgi:hypothetical protein